MLSGRGGKEMRKALAARVVGCETRVVPIRLALPPRGARPRGRLAEERVLHAGKLPLLRSQRDAETRQVMGERETEGLGRKRKAFEVGEKYFQT